MGAWGSDSFDNDTAADWVYSLEEATDATLVRQTLADGSGDEPDADAASEAIAAAEVVAAGLGRPAADLPPSVTAWVADHGDEDWASLAEPARAAVANIREASELAELWDESGADGWHAALDDLAARLG